jgi:hypothetical protein
MPRSAESLRAAAEFRRQEMRVRAGFLREFLALWPLLDKANVSETSPNWLRLSLALIQRWRGPAALTARTYYEKASQLDTGRDAPRFPSVDPVEAERVYRSLLHTGPGTLKRARLVGLDELEAGDRAMRAAADAASRHVLNAGREQIHSAVLADRRAMGWMRVTDGNPCAFCAMLASRGAVYKSADSARFTDDGRGNLTLYHDNCACQAVPVFTRTPMLPEVNQRFADLWRSSTRGLSNNEARAAFRRAVEGR